MVAEGLVLMVVGMGTVFALLSLLVIVMQIAASFFASWPEDQPAVSTRSEQQGTASAVSASQAQDDELELIAIALAAIQRS